LLGVLHDNGFVLKRPKLVKLALAGSTDADQRRVIEKQITAMVHGKLLRDIDNELSSPGISTSTISI
jgi:hypothetical protein